MDDVYTEHTVSVKIAIYSHDAQKVLVMAYPDRKDLYGLPGGHLEENEFPDEALIRELNEELGITLDTFERNRFFLRSGRGSSVILGYTATAPRDLVLHPPRPEKEMGVWVTLFELQAIEDISSEYKKLIIENWPTK